MKVYTEYCFSYDHAADLLNKRREENLNLDNVLYVCLLHSVSTWLRDKYQLNDTNGLQ